MKTTRDATGQVEDAFSGAPNINDSAIRDSLVRLGHVRGEGKSFCPSEVARELSDDWRPLMPAVRQVAGALVDEGQLICTQRGISVDPRAARGPIRLAIPPKYDTASPDGAES